MRAWLLVVLVACNSRSFGDGIGRPVSDASPSTSQSPTQIVEVFAQGAAANHFVEILNSATSVQSLSGWALCHEESCVDVDADLGADERVAIEAEELGLLPSVGDVRLEDNAGAVRSYLAWGSDPSLWGSRSVASAFAGGALRSFVPLPYPYSSGSVVFEDDHDGCASETRAMGPVATELGAGFECPASAGALELNEVDPDGGSVEIINTSTQTVNVFGVILCVEDCVALEAAALASGGVTVAEDVLDAALFGEVAVLTPGGTDLSQTERLVSYVRFGTDAPSGFAAQAVSEGIWDDPADSVPLPAAGESLQRNVAQSGVSAWASGAPTPGVP